MGRMRCYSWERAASSNGGVCGRYWLLAAVRLRVETFCGRLRSSHRARGYWIAGSAAEHAHWRFPAGSRNGLAQLLRSNLSGYDSG